MEGREITDFLEKRGHSVIVCVATDYGADLAISEGPVTLQVRTGRMGIDRMRRLLREQQPGLVIDATHPYAGEVKYNIQMACQAERVRCWRIQRDAADEDADGILTFATMEGMVDWLNETPGVIFSTLGAKEAAALSKVQGAAERLWLRVLPSEESLRQVAEAGLPARHVIAMQGPFSQALNEAMFRETKAKILLTKNSGTPGGFLEKCRASLACDMIMVVLARPKEMGACLSLEQVKRLLEVGLL